MDYRRRGNLIYDDVDVENDLVDHGIIRNAGYRPHGNFVREQHGVERFCKLKYTMPKFEGGSDPETYLTWELKVDKIFRMHNYFEEKKLAMVSLEFEDYALIRWEQVNCQQREEQDVPTATWAELKQ